MTLGYFRISNQETRVIKSTFENYFVRALISVDLNNNNKKILINKRALNKIKLQ